MIAGIVGAVLGTVVPSSITGVDFALTALFVVLAYEAFVTNPDFSLPLAGFFIAVLVAVIAPSWLLMIALSAYFIVLLVRFALPGVDKALELRR